MSNNTIQYTIYKDGEPVVYHTQNFMCRRCNDNLMKFQPAKDYTIVCQGYEDHYDGYYDDEEDYYDNQEPEELSLEEWLAKNPGEFTHINFMVGDTIKLTKKRGLAKVIEVLKGKWHPEYLVDMNGGQVVVSQTEIIPS